MSHHNYYTLLGLNTDASILDIKRVINKKLAIYHPDKLIAYLSQFPENQHETKKNVFKNKYELISYIKLILTNPVTKTKYDTYLSTIIDTHHSLKTNFKSFVSSQINPNINLPEFATEIATEIAQETATEIAQETATEIAAEMEAETTPEMEAETTPEIAAEMEAETANETTPETTAETVTEIPPEIAPITKIDDITRHLPGNSFINHNNYTYINRMHTNIQPLINNNFIQPELTREQLKLKVQRDLNNLTEKDKERNKLTEKDKERDREQEYTDFLLEREQEELLFNQFIQPNKTVNEIYKGLKPQVDTYKPKTLEEIMQERNKDDETRVYSREIINPIKTNTNEIQNIYIEDTQYVNKLLLDCDNSL